MNADTPDPSQIAHLLAQREAMLLAQLRPAGLEIDASEVHDFKEAADRSAGGALDDARQAQAAAELAEVVAARRRLEAGRYGRCEDCGEPVAPARLAIMPATRFCARCEAARERTRG